MKSLLRRAASISSLITFAFVCPAIAQMQPQQRASAFPMRPPTARTATVPYATPYNPAARMAPRAGYIPAAAPYGYGQNAFPTPPRTQRPAARVAQAFGPPMQSYAGVPGMSPSAMPAYAPAAPNYVNPETITPTAPAATGQVVPQTTAPHQALSAPQALIGAPPMAAPAMGAMGQATTNEIPMVAPTQHIIDGGAGCAGDGGCVDMSYAGDGMIMGGEMGYVGGDCGAPAAPVYAPTVDAAPTWFGGFYGLIMNRDDGNDICFLREPGSFTNQYLSTRDAAMEPSGGYEVRFGRIFNGGSWGTEFVYWELFPEDQVAGIETALQPVAQLYTKFDYGDVFFNGVSGADLFGNNGAIVASRVRRGFSFQNIELNLLSGPLIGGGGLRAGQATPFGQGYAGIIGDGGCYGGGGACYGPSVGAGCGGGCGEGCGSPCDDLYGAPCGTGGCGPALQVGWLFGLRYFKFDENLGVDYDIADNVYDGGASEFRHDVSVENDLVGCQLGLNLNYALTNCLCFDGGTKFGLFGNRISTRQVLQTDTDLAYIQDSAGTETDFDFVDDDNDIAFLGEMRFGAAYKIGCHWRLSGGYRVLALSGVGLAQNAFIGKVGDVDRNGHLILHGAYAGVEFCW